MGFLAARVRTPAGQRIRWATTGATALGVVGFVVVLAATGPGGPAQAAPPGPLALQAVVTVLVDGRPVGSGFVVSPEGYILTVAHAVAQPGRLSVRFATGHQAGAEAIALDDGADVALLRASVRFLPALSLGDSRNLKAGDRVWVAGAPLGLEQSVSSGYVAASRRVVEDRTYIQLDISLNPGNSGGPVLDEEGRVVGIAAARVGNAQGIGLAIPVAALEKALARWQVAMAADLTYQNVALQPAREGPAWGRDEEMRAVGWATAAVSVAVLATGAGVLVWSRRRRRRQVQARRAAASVSPPGTASPEGRRGMARLRLRDRWGHVTYHEPAGTASQAPEDDVEVILHDRR